MKIISGGLLEGKKDHRELHQLIHSHELISFDIYDTALFRNVMYPTDIFDIVSLKLQRNNIKLKDFKKLRIKAEEKARSMSDFEDIDLEDIYHVISQRIGNDLSCEIKKIELSTEQEFTVCNAAIKKMYDMAKGANKKIIFISDMYLPKDFLCSLLLDNGFDVWDDVFVSGSIGISKASTKLFDYVRGKMKVNTTWLHIGDNFISDYKNAISSDINAFHYQRNEIREETGNKYSIEQSIMKAIQMNYCERTEPLSYWKKFGANIVSSLFFGFTHWLAQELKGKENAYFLSRDGYLPQKLYEKFQMIIDDLPQARYIHASRRVYQIPNILNMSQRDALGLLTAYNEDLGQVISLAEIFDNIGLDREQYIELIRDNGFTNFTDIIKSDEDRSKAKQVLSIIYPDIIDNLQKENLILQEYLRQNNIYEYDELNIVDVGWRGSTHKAIKDITNIATNGYYFGTTYNVYNDIVDRVYGYAFNVGKPYKNAQKIMDNVMMYELIFSAPQGSLIGFQKSADHIFPILQEVEKNDFHYQCLSDIQSAILEITDQYLLYYEFLKNMDRKNCLLDYFKFIDAKKNEDLNEFSKLSGAVGIGDSRELQKYVTTVTFQEYNKYRKEIERNISKNLWKNSLIIKGSISEQKRKTKILKLKSMRLKSQGFRKKIIKAIKNPQKAVWFIKKMLIK